MPMSCWTVLCLIRRFPPTTCLAGACRHRQLRRRHAGSFNARSNVQLALNRCVRRYINTVAESVLAADGVLRLRDRQSDRIAANSTAIDKAESAAAIQTTDIEVDPHNAIRMIGEELVWVEGDMRVLGDARLWGTKLELRDTTGAPAGGAPEYIQRNGTLNAKGGQDLDFVFGAKSGTPGQDRMVFGTVDGLGTCTPTSCSAPTPGFQSAQTRSTTIVHLANNLVIASTADTGISIVSNAANTGNIFFATGTIAPNKNAGFITYDQQLQEMNFGVASTEVMSLTADGQMAIGPVDGTLLANNFAQLAIANPAGGGTRLLLEITERLGRDRLRQRHRCPSRRRHPLRHAERHALVLHQWLAQRLHR